MKIKDHFLTQETFEICPTEINGIYKTYPIPENLAPYYDSKEYISHHQDSGSLKEFIYKLLQTFNLSYKKNLLIEYAGKNKKVLDYGCGAGEFIKYIEKDFKSYGYEPNEIARNYAKAKTNNTKLLDNLHAIPDHYFDIITLWHVFEHIENQDEILNLLQQKLNKQGLLIIAVPNHTSFDAIKYKSYWAAYDVPRHLFHFSKQGMLDFLNRKNWKIKKVKPLLLDSFYISILSEKYKKSRTFWLRGLVYGMISNIKALKTGEFSSLIYIVEKKEKIDF